MPALRKFVIAAALAIAGTVSFGAAQAHDGHHYNRGLYKSDLRYCHLPFYRMVDLFGYGNAVDLKVRCRRAMYRHYY